ncbi:Mitochondrial distribution and morphology protein 12 [Serendipita sp. 399]|nr:Mitochondrial distribution and morphology protein 12 [Serendipita sp. 399]
MSIDLDWSQLSTLTNRLVDALNRHLQTTERPSFMGPITINSFEFGIISPDAELVDVRDIYRDFLEETDDEDESASGSEHDTDRRSRSYSRDFGRGKEIGFNGDRSRSRLEENDDFEWVKRRGSGRAVAENGPGYHPFPPHVRYGGGVITPILSGMGSTVGYPGRWTMGDPEVVQRPNNGQKQSHLGLSERPENISIQEGPSPDHLSMTSKVPSINAAPPRTQPPTLQPPNTENDLQFHLHITHHSDMRISISTSLLLNYPSPLFMALPIRLTIIGFEFDGEVVVAYQPSRKRIHLCILDDQDLYRPASASTQDERPKLFEKDRTTAGMRLLPQIFIETEIGQADKQVLRNVSRVERFLQEMIRTTLEEELVFPNFHTIMYGEDADPEV